MSMTKYKERMQNRLMKPRECAQIADVSPRTIVRWIRQGKIAGVKVGRVWRIRVADWEAFLDGRVQSE